jgi:hypothetical protein
VSSIASDTDPPNKWAELCLDNITHIPHELPSSTCKSPLSSTFHIAQDQQQCALSCQQVICNALQPTPVPPTTPSSPHIPTDSSMDSLLSTSSCSLLKPLPEPQTPLSAPAVLDDPLTPSVIFPVQKSSPSPSPAPLGFTASSLLHLHLQLLPVHRTLVLAARCAQQSEPSNRLAILMKLFSPPCPLLYTLIDINLNLLTLQHLIHVR